MKHNDRQHPAFGAHRRGSPVFATPGGSRCGVTPPYLSRVAERLSEDPDVLLAMGGNISTDLRAALLARPQLFADLVRAIRDMPDDAAPRVMREVRDEN